MQAVGVDLADPANESQVRTPCLRHRTAQGVQVVAAFPSCGVQRASDVSDVEILGPWITWIKRATRESLYPSGFEGGARAHDRPRSAFLIQKNQNTGHAITRKIRRLRVRWWPERKENCRSARIASNTETVASPTNK